LCGDLTYDEFLRDYLTQPYYPIVTVDKNGNFRQRSANASLPHKWNIPVFVWDERSQKQQVYWLRKSNILWKN
jgi:hypothetical protein